MRGSCHAHMTQQAQLYGVSPGCIPQHPQYASIKLCSQVQENGRTGRRPDLPCTPRRSNYRLAARLHPSQ